MPKSLEPLGPQPNMMSVHPPFPLEVLPFPEFAIPSHAMADASAFSRLFILITAYTSATIASMPLVAAEAKHFLIHQRSWQKSQYPSTGQIISKDSSSAPDLAGMRTQSWKR